VFSGDLTSFPIWVKSFEALIESNTTSPSERLYFLSKYTSGDAKQCIQGYFVQDGDQAFADAKATLYRRYGDKYRAAEAFKGKIYSWPDIKDGDGIGLRKLADYLQHCNSAMSTINHLQSLDSAEENKRILRKLPKYITSRWARIVDKTLYGNNLDGVEGHYPTFSEFCNFLATEARVACGPGHVQPAARYQPSGSSRSQTKSAISYWTEGTVGTKKEHCSMCRKEHHLSSCKQYLALDREPRKAYCMSKGICFNCLHRGHMSRECRRKGRSLLYTGLPPLTERKNTDPSAREGEDVEHRSMNLKIKTEDQETLHSLIIKVAVHHETAPDKVIFTYAMLDSQSDACFMTNSLAAHLDAPKENVKLCLTTMLEKQNVDSDLIHGLIVKGVQEDKQIKLPSVYTRGNIPIDRSLIPRRETVERWPHLQHIAQEIEPYDDRLEVGLLIGFNCSAAMLPKEVKAAGDADPFAIKTNLGWSVSGTMKQNHPENTDPVNHFVYKTTVKEVSPAVVYKLFDHDLVDDSPDREGLSQNDRKFLSIVEAGITKVEGHYEIPLPMKSTTSLPNNRYLAEKRLFGLQKKMKSQTYREDYEKFMQDITKRYAEKAPESTTEGKTWYLPHHGVYHPRPPDKIRVVFDGNAEFPGESLNQHLLPGPNLTNNLSGVLARFRQESVAVVCDIEGMFHQVKVPPDDRDYLRFLWYEDGKITEYRMTVHLFGAASSPSCANFALKRTADEAESKYGKKAADFVRDDFYVDDGLKSVPTVEEAVELAKQTTLLCREGGFNLHKFSSTHREVLASITQEKREKKLQHVDLAKDQLPSSRTLGIEWAIEEDEFRFRIAEPQGTVTRRSILSSVSSIFDPLGLISPLLLQGRIILQSICKDGRSWDEPLPAHTLESWNEWRNNLQLLKHLRIPRCYKTGPDQPRSAEIHHFSDASLTGYGMCSYLKLIYDNRSPQVTLVTSKSRVAPSKPVTVPRLELMAAVLAAKVATFLDTEMRYDNIRHVFWTDSKVVLGYIYNDHRRFHMFVSNRVHQIRSVTQPEQWNYVETEENPADLASRGLPVDRILSSTLWWKGPEFLMQPTPLPLTKNEHHSTLLPDDPNVRKTTVLVANSEAKPEFKLSERLEYFSNWYRARRAVARCLQLKQRLKKQRSETKGNHISVSDINEAERVIIRAVQEDAFAKERDVIVKGPEDVRTRKETIKQHSSLYRLDPFVDENGVIRVGGRIKRANIPRELSHPVILPQHSHITTLVINHYHAKTCHAGANTTLNEIRASGFWIIKGRSAVTSHVWNCVGCRKLRASTVSQKMSDLPVDRLEPAPPFSASGVDMFGPFYIKEGRSEKKRWGVIFTCLSMRAIHIEVARALTTDGFINAYRRFVARRGPIRTLRCDCGTNFVGAKNEFEAALSEMDNDRIQQRLLQDGCDWISFKMNVPHASHMGGVWERMIRSVRNVLSGILLQHGEQLDDDLLHTFMIEAEAVVNSRPLTYHDKSPDSPEPLTPSQLLTLKAKVVLPPPGKFVKEDLYCRRRWRRVQYLANEFWSRWRKEYLTTLQDRRKWCTTKDNIKPGDVVLMVEDNVTRSQWPLGVITETNESVDGHIRKVRVKTSTSSYDRPVSKLVFLLRPE
jgi:hypothetical protein